MIYIVYYLAILNICSLLLMGLDKYHAKTKGQRIRERTLLLTAVVGGSIGVFLGMVIFHHKIRKNKFRYGIPIIIIIQVLIINKALVLIG